VEKVDKATKECLNSLKLLHDAGEIDRAALLSARGRILSARNAVERDEIVRNLIRNVGKRHRSERKEAEA
jgi:outer membrane protein TolC